MGRTLDLTGQKFNNWLVLKRVDNDKHGASKWLCECDCENRTQREIVGSDLKRNHSKSCGCVYNKIHHGLSNSRIYKIYGSMIERCYNPKAISYKYYGMKGVEVCEEWLYNFLTFYNWAISNGYTDELTIDRINVYEGYKPSNCKWATMKEQGNNRTNNHYIEINGETKTISQWADDSNISLDIICYRLKKGMLDNDLIKPVRNKSKNQSGVSGINWNGNGWKVGFRIGGKRVYLGHYVNLKDAIKTKK